MVEKDGFMTVELSKNDKLLESYSTSDREQFKNMVDSFSNKIRPQFKSDHCENDTYKIHMYTY